MLYEPAELLKAANAMAEAEATKQTSIDEMVISLTRATPRASGDCAGLEEIEILVAGSTDENGAVCPMLENGLREPPGAMIDMIGSRITRGVQRAQSSPGGCLSTHRQPGPATRRACASQQPQSSLL